MPVATAMHKGIVRLHQALNSQVKSHPLIERVELERDCSALISCTFVRRYYYQSLLVQPFTIQGRHPFFAVVLILAYNPSLCSPSHFSHQAIITDKDLTDFPLSPTSPYRHDQLRTMLSVSCPSAIPSMRTNLMLVTPLSPCPQGLRKLSLSLSGFYPHR